MLRIFFIIYFILGSFLGYDLHANYNVVKHFPTIYNYNYIAYNGGTQNWAITQNSNGLIYVANNQGILEFTGLDWEKYPIKGNKIVRSVFIDETSAQKRLYVGAFEEFGYYERDKTNNLKYHSLLEKLEDYKLKNDEIWNIVKVGNLVYFQSFSSYFVYDGESVIGQKSKMLNLLSSGGFVFSQFIGDDFYILRNQKFEKLIGRSQYNNDYIVGVVNFDDSFLFVTANSGIYKYNFKNKKLKQLKNKSNEQLKKATANRVIQTIDEKIIIGSLNNGVFALDKEGNLLWNITQNNGINNNTVLGLFEDSQKNIWLALDNGISMLDNTPKFHYYDFSNKIGMIEDIEILNDKMFLATNFGIYRYDLSNGDFKKIPRFNSQVWFIDKYDKQIFVGHNRGTAILEGEKLKNIPKTGVGGMDIKQGVIHGKDVLIESSYTYLTLFEKNKNNLWLPKHFLGQFTDLINQIEIDHTGAIWANHAYKGVYRIHLSENLKDFREVKLYESPNIDTSKITNCPLQLLKLRGRIVLNDGKKFYTYADEKQPASLEPFILLNEHLQELSDTKKIIAIDDDNFWFVTQQAYYLVNFTDKYNIIDKIPFNTLKHTPNIDRAGVYVDEKGESYFCMEGCVAKYLGNKKENSDYKIILNNIIATDRKENIQLKIKIEKPIVIDNKYNNLTFNFQFPNFSTEEYKFSYNLENYEKQWSVPSKTLTIGYQNLPYGEYNLKVKVYNQLGHVISSVNIPFTLYIKWYKTNEAFVIYIILFLIIIIVFFIIYNNKNIEKVEQAFNQKDKKRKKEIETQRKEIDVLRNEKLKTELFHKTKELSTAMVVNIKHDEFLTTLIKELENIKKDNFSIKKLNRLINQIKNNISNERDWVILRQNFDLIHKNYFINLKERYPQLTPNDLRLSVLLSLNYSTKEIASIQGISVRGVEMARYRLRKKLNIEGDVNLTEFLLKFGS